jgi:hypothetical protein
VRRSARRGRLQSRASKFLCPLEIEAEELANVVRRHENILTPIDSCPVYVPGRPVCVRDLVVNLGN